MLNADMLTYMPDLMTPRLRIRRLTMRDAQDIYRYSRDPEVARHVLWDAHRSIGDARAYLRYMLRRYRGHEPASWGIEYLETGRVIGTIGFMWIQDDNASAEVGYSLAREYWNQGIGTAMFETMISVAEKREGLLQLELEFIEGNARGRALYEKMGFRIVAMKPDAVKLKDGSLRNEYTMIRKM